MTNDETIKAIRELPSDHLVRLMNDAGFYQATDITTDDLKALAERVREAENALRGWLGWFEGPYSEGVSYIEPPLKRTRKALEASND